MTYLVFHVAGEDLTTDCTSPAKYCDSGYSVRFGSFSLFPVSNVDSSKKAFIFGVDNSSSMHIHEKEVP